MVRVNGVVPGGVQRVNKGHVFSVQGEAENVQVGFDSVRMHGFGEGHDAALEFPADAYLVYGYFMLVRDAAQDGFLQDASAGQGAP